MRSFLTQFLSEIRKFGSRSLSRTPHLNTSLPHEAQSFSALKICHFNTNSPLRHVNLTQICHFDTSPPRVTDSTCDGFVLKWRVALRGDPKIKSNPGKKNLKMNIEFIFEIEEWIFDKNHLKYEPILWLPVTTRQLWSNLHRAFSQTTSDTLNGTHQDQRDLKKGSFFKQSKILTLTLAGGLCVDHEL